VIETVTTKAVNLSRRVAGADTDKGEAAMPEMSWEQMLPAYRESLVRFAQSYAHRSCEAEDVVQDVFVRIIRKDQARQGAPLRCDRPGAYLRRAVANESVSHWRRSSRERLTEQLPERIGADHSDAVLDRLVIRDAIAQLPERMRQVVTLSFLEGMSDADVAAVLEITEITVRTTRKRALAHLRLALADFRPVRTASGSAQSAPVPTHAVPVPAHAAPVPTHQPELASEVLAAA
jgi:RNA polymerase sigma factor (sigma-70 family)